MASFLGLGFAHHMIIVRKTNSLAERLFYIRQAFANKWSKEVLAARIEDRMGIANEASNTIDTKYFVFFIAYKIWHNDNLMTRLCFCTY